MMTETAKVAYVFPGQGAQYTGMGRDLYAGSYAARRVFEQADEALGFSLSQLCFEGPDDELCQTINAQPAIVTISLALLSAIRSSEDAESLPAPAFVAGHSLGEYTALAAAGVFDFATAIYLARERGSLMHQAGMQIPGGMAAVIGLDEASLADICIQSGTKIANFNCPSQLVISGKKENVNRAIGLAEAKGAQRVVPLQVSGAFHTHYMQPAADSLAEIIASISFSEPQVPIIANATAGMITTAEMVKEELLCQLCNSVKWQRSIEYIIDSGVSTFIEIGPGRVLGGLIKRINKSAKTISIGDMEAITRIAGLLD